MEKGGERLLNAELVFLAPFWQKDLPSFPGFLSLAIPMPRYGGWVCFFPEDVLP